MVKKVPQRRNKLAGKGKKRSSARKKAYDTKYHATKARKKYRARLNKANRTKPNKKGYDKSHTKSGKLVNERQSANRARNKRGRSKK
tara:strand:+ start:1755 stop:2015 length:261 start_codon:yes stop_codon:yes gene_type:complete